MKNTCKEKGIRIMNSISIKCGGCSLSVITHHFQQYVVSSGAQPPARQAEVGAANSGVEQGGSRCQDIGTDLFWGGTIGPAIRFIYMGTDTLYEEGVGRIQP